MKVVTFRGFIKFLNFSSVGLTTFALQVFFTLLLTEKAGIRYYISFAIAYVIAWALNFLINMKVTFGVADRLVRRAGRFAAASVFVLVANWFLLLFWVEVAGLHYAWAIAVSAIIMAAVNFCLQDFWVFRMRK
jgi:putative flippase GtrA